MPQTATQSSEPILIFRPQVRIIITILGGYSSYSLFAFLLRFQLPTGMSTSRFDI